MSGKADVIPLLLDAGVDVDTVVRNGVTAFMMAALFGHTETMQRLLDAGADAHLGQCDGMTALAMAKGHSQVHQFLKQSLGIAADAGDLRLATTSRR